MKYKSKKDWWVHLIIVMANALSVWVFVDGKYLTGAILLTVNAAITLPIYFATYYVIEEEYLKVRCGFSTIRIRFKDIESIIETRSILASTALSLDRLEIKYKKSGSYNAILVSPENKEHFVYEINSRR